MATKVNRNKYTSYSGIPVRERDCSMLSLIDELEYRSGVNVIHSKKSQSFRLVVL